MMNARSKERQAPAKRNESSKENLIAFTSSIYPTLGLPSNFHGAYVTLHQNGLGLRTVQTYSQSARSTKIDIGHIENESYLDVNQRRQACLVQIALLTMFLTNLAESNSVGFRSELGFSVSCFSLESFKETIVKAFHFKFENVVLFTTTEILKFSYLWASTAIHLKLLAIDCLDNQLASVEDRKTHLLLDTIIEGLLGKYFKGFSGIGVAGHFFESLDVLNFQLLPKLSSKMLSKLSLNHLPFSETNNISSSSSENRHAAVFCLNYNIFIIHFFNIFFIIFVRIVQGAI
jgi:hypothetical protein